MAQPENQVAGAERAPAGDHCESRETALLDNPRASIDQAQPERSKAQNGDLRRFGPTEMPATFRKEWADFMQVTTLCRRAGCSAEDLATVAAKELIDNAHDASPTGIEVSFVGRTLIVHDRGAGLAEDRVRDIFDITRPSFSSKRWRMARRGALGNGSRVVMGVASVSGGRLTIEARGIGQELMVASDGSTIVRPFASDVQDGTRVSLTFGPKIEIDADEIMVIAELAAAGAGSAFGGTRAVPSWFDVPAIRELIRDASDDTSVMDFAKRFDLTADALGEIKALAMRTTTADLLRDQGRLDRVIAAILGGQKGQRRLNKMGRNARPGDYASEEIEIGLGDAVVPAIVECWIEGRPVQDRKKDDGEVNVGTIFVNRTPALMQYGRGKVDRTSKSFQVYLGPGVYPRIEGLLKAPCHFDIELAITVPELPLVSDGKAIDLKPFKHAIEHVLRAALPRAYVPPIGKVVAATEVRNLTVKEAVYRVISSAYAVVSAANIGAPPRMLFYRCRPQILQLTGREELNYNTFKNALHDYIEDHPDETASWQILYDDRGHFSEPRRASFGIGTVKVGAYIDGLGPDLPDFDPAVGLLHIEHRGAALTPSPDPSLRYSAVIFVEKEGYTELLENARIALRFDVAFASTKGVPTTAIRRLLDSLAAYGVKVFVLHDFDIAGMKIAHTIRTSNERYRFENSIDMVDMGVRLADAEELGLDSEPVSLAQSPDALRKQLVGYGATPAEIGFLVDGKRRIEIDAMTPGQLVQFIERKLIEHGVSKIVPIEEAMEPYYLRRAAEIRIEEALAALRAEFEERATAVREQMRADGVLNIEVPILADRVRAALEADPDQSWIEAVEKLAQEDES